MLWSLSTTSSKLFLIDRNSFQFSQLELLIIKIILIDPTIHQWYLAVCSGNLAESKDESLGAVIIWFDSSIVSPNRTDVKINYQTLYLSYDRITWSEPDVKSNRNSFLSFTLSWSWSSGLNLMIYIGLLFFYRYW